MNNLKILAVSAMVAGVLGSAIPVQAENGRNAAAIGGLAAGALIGGAIAGGAIGAAIGRSIGQILQHQAEGDGGSP